MTDKPKETTVQVRMDKEMLEKLDYIVAQDSSLDRSKVLRKGVEIQYCKAKK